MAQRLLGIGVCGWVRSVDALFQHAHATASHAALRFEHRVPVGYSSQVRSADELRGAVVGGVGGGRVNSAQLGRKIARAFDALSRKATCASGRMP